MTAQIERFLEELEDFRKTPESVALELRLSFTELVMEQLGEKGWTQKQLAEKAGVKESFISRVLHGDENWKSETIGKILWALGVRAKVTRSLWAAPGIYQIADSVKIAGTETSYGQAENVRRAESICEVGGEQISAVA
jgi:transcriptional regulator with XRE-family HTH domain